MLKSLGKALVLIRNESSMSGPTQHVNVFVFGPFLFVKNLQGGGGNESLTLNMLPLPLHNSSTHRREET